MVGGCEGQDEAAQVELAQVFQCRLQFFARRFGACTAQGLHQHLGRCKTLQHGGADFEDVTRLGQGGSFLHQGVVLRLRQHLAHDHTPRVVAQQFDEAAGCVVGQGDELCTAACGFECPDGVHHGGARANHHDGLGAQFCHGRRNLREVRLAAVKLGNGDRGQFGGGQAFLGALQAVGAKTVVHVHHANAVDAGGCQVGDGALSLALVGGAYVEHMFFQGLV